MAFTRRDLLRASVTALWGMVSAPAQRLVAREPSAMSLAAKAFIDTLAEKDRGRGVFPFEDRERFNWHYTPRRRQGVAIRDMNEAQRVAAHALLRTALSDTGYEQAVQTMQLEAVLKTIETFGFNRDPENYALTVFGDPTAFPWGWRFEGHHLSLNFSVIGPAQVTITPAFIGSNPATVPVGESRGLRTMALEEDLGRSLITGLSRDNRAQAIIAERSFGDILSGPGRADALSVQEGLPIGQMRGETRNIAERLVEVYLGNASEAVASSHRRRISEAGIESVRFAWAGFLEEGKPHYYRLHGSRLLIEFDKTRNDANHIHSVLRDPSNDFGSDYLGEHYATAALTTHDHSPHGRL